MGLLEALKQYASDAAGGSLNPEVGNTLSGLLNYGKDRAKYIGGLLDDNSQINQDFQGWHKRTQLGLADLIAGKEGPQADYGYSQMMNMAGVAPVGMTAWHGSPHKFDKFSLDKIGTGEGAQAYGHGLYLAENNGVANQYAQTLANENARLIQNGVGVSPDAARMKIMDKIYTSVPGISKTRANELAQQMVDGRLQGDDIAHFERFVKNSDWEPLDKQAHLTGLQESKAYQVQKPEPQLYKTDIPDEAVARFLDWDKPMSQQAPEVRIAINRIAGYDLPDHLTGMSAQTNAFLNRKPDGVPAAKAQEWFANEAHSAGIPGIRYLDGGSRSAGQGSSNFVAFDPEMIRILERNGQPTGLEPWKPGEYRLGDLLK